MATLRKEPCSLNCCAGEDGHCGHGPKFPGSRIAPNSKEALVQVVQILVTENQYLESQLAECRRTLEFLELARSEKLDADHILQTFLKADCRSYCSTSGGDQKQEQVTNAHEFPEYKNSQGRVKVRSSAPICKKMNPWMCVKVESPTMKSRVSNSEERVYKGKNLQKCKFCNKPHIWGSRNCSAYGKRCKKCFKMNHSAEACKSKTSRKIYKSRSVPSDTTRAVSRNYKHDDDGSQAAEETVEKSRNKSPPDSKTNEIKEEISDRRKEPTSEESDDILKVGAEETSEESENISKEKIDAEVEVYIDDEFGKYDSGDEDDKRLQQQIESDMEAKEAFQAAREALEYTANCELCGKYGKLYVGTCADGMCDHSLMEEKDKIKLMATKGSSEHKQVEERSKRKKRQRGRRML